jgi:hypothetical protein
MTWPRRLLSCDIRARMLGPPPSQRRWGREYCCERERDLEDLKDLKDNED